MGNAARITIMGAGTSGLAFAVDCIRRGFAVLVYTHKHHRRTMDAVTKSGHLTVKGIFEDRVKIDFTTNPREATEFSNILVMSIRGDAHVDIWPEFQGIDLRSHIIVFIPGSCYERQIPGNIKFDGIFQAISNPIGAIPADKDDAIDIAGKKACLTVSGTNRRYNRMVETLLGTKVDWAHNEMDIVTQQPSGIFHPPMMIGNADRILSGQDFLIYDQGLTSDVINMIGEIDSVRCNIREAMGYPMIGPVQALNKMYGQNYRDIEHFRQQTTVHKRVKAPKSMRHRFLVEDVHSHWVLWYEMAELLGIDASPLRKGIEKAAELAGQNFFETGVTLQKLGLGKCSREAFIYMYGAKKVPEELFLSSRL
ncbi:hypothetical protein XA68_10661 [Ophiocordyceps unilateralis]|uniref:Opine dehydrogenase domain-containing protein n=1 Tax=Ophiocordyceps unilateralis TaxID=268505 RepID=A0A2A9PGI4_OPHUN|nr:hypothetical protein XA68_10661 [Ophiocordyceps unilateralis]